MPLAEPRTPPRTRPALAVAVLVAVALLAALLTVLLRPAGNGGGQPTATPGPAATPPAVTAGPTAAAPAPAKPAPAAPSTPTRPAHDGVLQETGYLTAAHIRDGQLTITVDRVIFLTGDEATQANGGVPPDNDHLIINDNPKLRTYVVAPDAALVGVTVLGGDDSATSAEPITAQELVDRTRQELDLGGFPLVDVSHRSATDATVTAVHERYVP